MSGKKINQLIEQLKQQLHDESLDNDNALHLIEKLEQQLAVTTTTNPSDNNEVMEAALLLETQFATQHPTAEKIIRELINTLGRIGI